MARRAAPFTVFSQDGFAYLNTKIGTKRIREALGVRLPEPASAEQARAANEAAAKRYAELIDGRRLKAGPRVTTSHTLEELAVMWLEAIETPTNTESVKTLTTYAGHWSDFGATAGADQTGLERLSADAGPADYAALRLRAVLRKTVRKEVSSLFQFLEWCRLHGHLAGLPPRPVLPKGATGVRSGKQRAKPVHVTPAQARAIIAALPQWSSEGGTALAPPFRVRDVLAFMWETGLRPATIARLSVPENFRPGSRELTLRDEDDKVRYGRTLGLSKRAISILQRLAPARGLIFGKHDYKRFVKAAALHVLPADEAKRFASYDFRHGRALAWLEESGNLPGVAYLLGHKQITTTNAYLAPQRRQGDDVIRRSAS